MFFWRWVQRPTLCFFLAFFGKFLFLSRLHDFGLLFVPFTSTFDSTDVYQKVNSFTWGPFPLPHLTESSCWLRSGADRLSNRSPFRIVYALGRTLKITSLSFSHSHFLFIFTRVKPICSPILTLFLICWECSACISRNQWKYQHIWLEFFANLHTAKNVIASADFFLLILCSVLFSLALFIFQVRQRCWSPITVLWIMTKWKEKNWIFFFFLSIGISMKTLQCPWVNCCVGAVHTVRCFSPLI